MTMIFYMAIRLVYVTAPVLYLALRNFGDWNLNARFPGRFPVLVPFQSLDETMLVRILTEPKNSITAQYKLMFDMDGVGFPSFS